MKKGFWILLVLAGAMMFAACEKNQPIYPSGGGGGGGEGGTPKK